MCIIGWLRIRSWDVDRIKDRFEAAFNVPVIVFGDE